MPRHLILFIFSSICLGIISCNSTKNIAGKYGTNFTTGGFFGTTITLKQDKTLTYRFGGDLIDHHLTGHYQVYDGKVFMTFDKELVDSNMASAPLFSDALYKKIYYNDTISYKKFCYIGQNKLFFAHWQTDKKVNRATGYCKRKKYLFFGSHYYRRRYYLKRRD